MSHTHSNTLMNLTVRSTTTLTHTNASVSVTSDRKSHIQYHLCSMKALTLCYQPCDSDSSMCDNSTLERLQIASKHTCHPFFIYLYVMGCQEMSPIITNTQNKTASISLHCCFLSQTHAQKNTNYIMNVLHRLSLSICYCYLILLV